MAKNHELRDAESELGGSPLSASPDAELAIMNAAGDVSDEVRESLFDSLASQGEEGFLAASLAEGMLLAVLKLIGPEGKYAMDKGRFWQVLDRHCPFAPLDVDAETRSRLEGEIDDALRAAESEVFEDGFDSNLSLELQRLLLKHGDMTVEIVADRVLGDRVTAEVAAEVLRCFGEVEHGATCDARERLLERGLTCSSHVARDGAVLGLADLSDGRSVPALEAAAAIEKHERLRGNMVRLVRRLEELRP